MKNITRLLLLAVIVTVSACSTPWVKPYERAHLSDPIMNPSRDPASASYIHHVHETREASRGAGSVSGGGCGCN